ncbi:MTAP family purine nucleoside phosphorylase [Methanolapillus ohkumae]|uniref:Probable S-methyl-5'-thioinosine phosphorylase n=1 Tax=Methanolapillus ohkumae TaxID=3028298 RepID=A0AA96VF17_9EURY|nr:S-methyl-5'-thioinosine phosphorylase [Methanosarcinaceae archaeon Am2]
MNLKKIALTVIGGVGYGNISDTDAIQIKTKYGNVEIQILHPEKSAKIVLISRHQGKRHVPPHQVNYKALIAAAQKIGAPVLSVNSVGSMKPEILSGEFVIPNDFLDLTKSRENTFYDKRAVHVDMSNPYCCRLRRILGFVLEGRKRCYTEGVYACTEGPRFETKAEIRMYSQFADVVGMTGVPEVVLAKEAGLCYASLCLVTNPAAGLCPEILTVDEIQEGVVKNQKEVLEVVTALAKVLGNDTESDHGFGACSCREAVQNSEI